MPGRSFASNSYRFGFNGKENDDESGTQDYGMRIYNPGMGKFLSIDPLTKSYPFYTPYQFASNSPIMAIDIDGLETSKQVNATENKTNSSEAPSLQISYIPTFITNQGDPYKDYPAAVTNGFIGCLNCLIGAWNEGAGIARSLSNGTFTNNFNTDANQTWKGIKHSFGQAQDWNPPQDLLGDFRKFLIKPSTVEKGVTFYLIAGGRIPGLDYPVTLPSATSSLSFGERLFLSEDFGVISKRFGNSTFMGGVEGTWNKKGSFLKLGWSGTSRNGGGMIMRLGVGVSKTNPNQAAEHLWFDPTHVPNSFSNPYVKMANEQFQMILKNNPKP